MSKKFYKNKSSKGSIYFVCKDTDLGTSHFVSLGVNSVNEPILIFTAMTSLGEDPVKQGVDYESPINLG